MENHRKERHCNGYAYVTLICLNRILFCFNNSSQITKEGRGSKSIHFLKATIMHQSIPSANIPPGNPRGFAPTFRPGPGICTIWIVRGFPGCRPFYLLSISTKLSVDAAWRHFPALNWSIIYFCFLVTKSASKPGENFRMIKYGTLTFQSFLRFDFCKIPKCRRRLTGKAD